MSDTDFDHILLPNSAYWLDTVIYYISIPVNFEGSGPCTPEETVGVVHEIWDAVDCFTLATSDSELAIKLAIRAIKNGMYTPKNVAELKDFVKSLELNIHGGIDLGATMREVEEEIDKETAERLLL